jgi:hypothetical protein
MFTVAMMTCSAAAILIPDSTSNANILQTISRTGLTLNRPFLWFLCCDFIIGGLHVLIKLDLEYALKLAVTEF